MTKQGNLKKIDKMENQKQFLLLKYKEMENHYKTQIIKLENYIIYLEDRTLNQRIRNDKKQLYQKNIISYEDVILLESGEQKLH